MAENFINKCTVQLLVAYNFAVGSY